MLASANARSAPRSTLQPQSWQSRAEAIDSRRLPCQLRTNVYCGWANPDIGRVPLATQQAQGHGYAPMVESPEQTHAPVLWWEWEQGASLWSAPTNLHRNRCSGSTFHQEHGSPRRQSRIRAVSSACLTLARLGRGASLPVHPEQPGMPDRQSDVRVQRTTSESLPRARVAQEAHHLSRKLPRVARDCKRHGYADSVGTWRVACRQCQERQDSERFEQFQNSPSSLWQCKGGPPKAAFLYAPTAA